jgi:hypothetical protein
MASVRNRCLVVAGVIAMSLTTNAALAQISMPALRLDNDRPLTKEEQEKRKEVDDAYKSAINKLPEKPPADPWGDMRSSAPNSKQR